MVRFGVPGQNVDPLAYGDSRLSTVPIVQASRRPTVNDKKFPIWCEWRVNKNATAPAAEGEFWKLIKFESNGDATWVRYYAGGVSGGLLDLRDQVGTDVTIDPVSSKIDIDSAIVANAANPSAIPLETVADATTHTLDLQLQLSTTVSPTPTDSNDVGVACFNTNQFTIDTTSGMVSLKGGSVNPPFLSADVDANTHPGTDPVLSDGTGTMIIGGDAVAAHSVPVETHSRAVNTFKTEVQLATTVTPTPANSNDVGLVSVNENQFAIDATSGMVSLKGGTVNPPIISFTLDDTNATTADGTGDIDITGSAVANATNAKPLFSARNPATDDIDIQLQLATVVSPTPADSNDSGISCYNTNQFTVDATSGMASLKGSTALAPVLTLTGSAGGGAISPDGSGNITLAGAGGASVTGAGTTITISAAAVGGGLTWREETGIAATFATDEGVFANNAATVTLTLPAAPSVGDTFAAYQEGAGKVRVAQNAGDQIRFGASTSTAGAGGYIESLNQGDCAMIVAVDASRFRVINSVGSWTVA